MTNMGLREEIYQGGYVDQFGLIAPSRVTPDRVYGSQNGLLFTAEFVVMLKKRGELTFDAKEHFFNIYQKCMVEKGLFARGPGHPEQEGPDDYVGIAALSYALDLPLAKWVLDYGRSHPVSWGPLTLDYNYNNVTPNTLDPRGSSWLGRQPQLIAHLMWAAGETPPLWMRLWWCLVIVLSTFAEPGDQDARFLSWLLVNTGKHGWIEKIAIKWWYYKLKKTYPDGMRSVAGSGYFEAGHPFIKYWVD